MKRRKQPQPKPLPKRERHSGSDDDFSAGLRRRIKIALREWNRRHLPAECLNKDGDVIEDIIQ